MNSLGRFESFSSPLGRKGVDGLGKICLKFGQPVALRALCGYQGHLLEKELYLSRLQGRGQFYVIPEVHPSLIQVQVNLESF